jgi:hypothetical protein
VASEYLGQAGRSFPRQDLRRVLAGLRLKAFFSRQWQQMPSAHFMAVFGPYSQHVAQVLERFDPAVVAAAAADVADSDDELPIRPEEGTR